MAYIVPNSTIKILHYINIDRNYNHTLYFINADAQYNYFSSSNLVKYTLTEYSYQRYGKNSIRVEILADLLFDCNYIMFQNTAFGDKWFYAFIDDVEYINNNTAQINYTLDVMQSWYFDYTLGECFVEREHTETDNVGENLIPENLETGEYICYNKTDILSQYMLSGIILTKSLPTKIIFPSGNYININNQEPLCFGSGSISLSLNGTNAPSGIVNGLTIYTGFSTCDNDINSYWKNQNNYALQDYNIYNSNNEIVGIYSMAFLIYIIRTGDITGISEDSITNVYQYSGEFSNNDSLSLSNIRNNRPGIGILSATNINLPSLFYTEVGTNYNNIKNKKLFTYPYVQVIASNNSGNTAEYKFEHSNIPYFIPFECSGDIIGAGNGLLYPINYRKISYDYDSGLALNNMPQPIYSGNSYGQWITTNRNSLVTGILSQVVSLGTSLYSGISGGTLSAFSGVTSNAFNIFNTMAKIKDIKNTPPQAYGQISSESLSAGQNRIKFSLYTMTIKAEFARNIDNYFNMFGYAIKNIKYPNIVSVPYYNLRPHWNYIKTQGCIIHANELENKGLPANDEEQIAKIYDNGITFWMNGAEVGNYSLDNSPASALEGEKNEKK